MSLSTSLIGRIVLSLALFGLLTGLLSSCSMQRTTTQIALKQWPVVASQQGWPTGTLPKAYGTPAGEVPQTDQAVALTPEFTGTFCESIPGLSLPTDAQVPAPTVERARSLTTDQEEAIARANKALDRALAREMMTTRQAKAAARAMQPEKASASKRAQFGGGNVLGSLVTLVLGAFALILLFYLIVIIILVLAS